MSRSNSKSLDICAKDPRFPEALQCRLISSEKAELPRACSLADPNDEGSTSTSFPPGRTLRAQAATTASPANTSSGVRCFLMARRISSSVQGPSIHQARTDRSFGVLVGVAVGMLEEAGSPLVAWEVVTVVALYSRIISSTGISGTLAMTKGINSHSSLSIRASINPPCTWAEKRGQGRRLRS